MSAAVVLVVPDGVDDPARVSGGNVYDRHVRDGLRALGWEVDVVQSDAAGAADAVDALPARALALIDGLVAGWAAPAVEDASRRARVVVLAHMVSAALAGADPVTVAAEERALRAAHRVVATSGWTAGELVRRGLVDPARTTVAIPGSDDRPATSGPVDHRALLSLGVVAPHKGQDVLLAALGRLTDPDWSLTIAGSTAADPAFAARVAVAAAPFGARVRMPGVLDGGDLDRAYRDAGVLVAPSRIEGFGMAIADARRRGMPVIATAAGGIPEAVAGGGAVLVRPGDPGALADALRRWMTDPALRARLRVEALRARSRAPRWADTVARVAAALESA